MRNESLNFKAAVCKARGESRRIGSYSGGFRRVVETQEYYRMRRAHQKSLTNLGYQ
ncbi:hypothetical protein MCHUDSM44219_00711 [Mycolicibacterium chubuense]|uniref:Uncharacterized protein n=1 Tax=Mycolicibacterium chubuense TaxID=1800 RepID=A0A0J6WPB4_MYCCU|nr:hypothetical protein MCHUDSM44219_00711 [Mycolicibacterium chubuense]SPY00406.1 Uncharacterised protein [Mycolicibacterium chubuense]